MNRKAQWRWDFVLSENSLGFHSSLESPRLPKDATDLAQQAAEKAETAVNLR